jgi:hypothetical protein
LAGLEMTVALVLGGAACLQDDLDAALALGEFDGVVAANDAGAWWPGLLDGWCSLHPQKLAKWCAARAERGYPPASRLFGHQNETRKTPGTEYTDHRFPGQLHPGSSGLFALKVALYDLGFSRAVCCGMPMDMQPHFYGGQGWNGAKSHLKGWLEALPTIKSRARSMGGWTADLLGWPTAEWVAGEPDYQQHDLGERGAA